MTFYETLVTDRAEWSDGNGATFSVPSSGGGVSGQLNTAVGGGTPTTVTVSFRAFNPDTTTETIAGVYLTRPGLDLAVNADGFSFGPGVSGDFAVALDFLATPAQILDAITTPNETALLFTSAVTTPAVVEASVVIGYDPLVSGVNPLRRFPPVNNGGYGPSRHWPRTVNRRAGGTY